MLNGTKVEPEPGGWKQTLLKQWRKIPTALKAAATLVIALNAFYQLYTNISEEESYKKTLKLLIDTKYELNLFTIVLLGALIIILFLTPRIIAMIRTNKRLIIRLDTSDKPIPRIPDPPVLAQVPVPVEAKEASKTAQPAPLELASKEKMAFPLPDKPSIAVLSFTNISGEKELGYLCDGLAEGIIDALSKSERIFVISRNSTFTYKGKHVKIKQVAEEMGVQYVIEGSVQREGNRVRVTAQFIDAMTGYHLFSERYDRELKDILSLQDEITMRVLEAVQVKLTTGEDARLYGKGTKNLAAYLKVIQARELILGTRNKERIERARQLIEEAITLDPKYAKAYDSLGAVHSNLFSIGASDSPKESLQRALELKKKAIALDDSDPAFHSALANVYMFLGESDKAMSEAHKSVSLGPNSAQAYYGLGWCLRMMGHPQEAITNLQKSLRLSPFPFHSNVLEALAGAYMDTGRYEEALATLKKELQLYGPDTFLAHVFLIRAYVLMGRDEEARAEGAEVLRIDPNFKIDHFIYNVYSHMNQSYKDEFASALRKGGLK